jgi:hypothetical protein
MKMNWKNFLSNALLAAMIFGLASCLDDDDDDFNIEADAYYINKLVDGVWVHGITYYVYGNQTMSSATVVTPITMETIELQAASGYYNVLVNSPEEGDYSTSYPEEGNFQFEVTSSKGEVLYSIDEQEFENLEGAKIDSIEFDSSNFLMKVTWNEIQDCDGYYVRMYNSSDELVFEGYGVASEVTEFVVSEYYTTGNWGEAPVKGEEYSVLLQTFVYDDDATSNDYSYNIKEVTITDTTVTWEF